MHKNAEGSKSYPKFPQQTHEVFHMRKSLKYGKNKVVHKVIHIIHILRGKVTYLKYPEKKQMFCD